MKDNDQNETAKPIINLCSEAQMFIKIMDFFFYIYVN